MATHSILGSTSTKTSIGEIQVDVSVPDLKEILERLSGRELNPPAPVVNVASPNVTVEPRLFCTPDIKINVPDINVPPAVVHIAAAPEYAVAVTLEIANKPALYSIIAGVYLLLFTMLFLIYKSGFVGEF